MALIPPAQLVAPIVGTSSAGTPAGSTTTIGMLSRRSSACIGGVSVEVTKMIPSVERARRLRSHCRAEVGWEWIAETTVPVPVACPASSTPRMISTAHGLSRSLKTRSIRPTLDVPAPPPVAVLAQQPLDALPGVGGDIGAAVEHPRHGRHRHAGRSRDGGDRDPGFHHDESLTGNPLVDAIDERLYVTETQPKQFRSLSERSGRAHA